MRKRRMRKSNFGILVALGYLGAGGIVACGPQNVGSFKTNSKPLLLGTGVSGGGAPTGSAAGAGGTSGITPTNDAGLYVTAIVDPPSSSNVNGTGVGPYTISFDLMDGTTDLYLSTQPTSTQSSQASDSSGDIAYTVQTQCVTSDCSSFAAYFVGNNMTTSNETLIAALFQNQGGNITLMNEIDNTPFSTMSSAIGALEGNNGVPL